MYWLVKANLTAKSHETTLNSLTFLVILCVDSWFIFL